MTTLEQRRASDEATSKKSAGFEYNFPAIRGVQAGREYYVTMCPLRLIPKLFSFDEEEVPAEMRAQRTLNKARIPEISRYIVENPDSYIFSALTASINADVQFEPIDGAATAGERVGMLSIPMSARFIINDGQHRRAAIQQALVENPDLGDESIAIVLFLDVGLKRCQQMFADLNRHAIRPSKSIGVLYDNRDELSVITKLIVTRSPFFSDLTETETSNLSIRSRKLFTLSALYSANKSLLEGIEVGSFERRVDLAARYWAVVADQFPEWHQVRRRQVHSSEIRRDFIHSHGIVLQSLGKIGNALIRKSNSETDWVAVLSKLGEIDWHRSNASVWEGRATIGGKVSKGASNILLTAGHIRAALGLELPPDEQQAEREFTRRDK
ncbi:DNA sulfur modification protein DndB [Mycobacterium intermedium]|uniref:DNA sulfur modification protein DndB n=1 Tax=Mycobacterium intermedium TaxID=28445 RepID=A0A1E3SAF5_MYCIE|nr:DNA sulfur modification protein DndB [Mycobacterium intermedium]MCV6967762.1 DNA sulfur modification protein DndB [Mycobacterium intermedium]ODQ99146.1 DNA sulfur modification protein DndB [Mycobacterium intermedium]OPE50549.1 DNA sulfur modification protein DndB [Mycobacterium intermedium]ORB05494.1 DNA sulfur modification protein DndB [Mycobacterium intermedium]